MHAVYLHSPSPRLLSPLRTSLRNGAIKSLCSRDPAVSLRIGSVNTESVETHGAKEPLIRDRAYVFYGYGATFVGVGLTLHFFLQTC
jgi:hypothetical protein